MHSFYCDAKKFFCILYTDISFVFVEDDSQTTQANLDILKTAYNDLWLPNINELYLSRRFT